jgi:hypothetical protein
MFGRCKVENLETRYIAFTAKGEGNNAGEMEGA